MKKIAYIKPTAARGLTSLFDSPEEVSKTVQKQTAGVSSIYQDPSIAREVSEAIPSEYETRNSPPPEPEPDDIEVDIILYPVFSEYRQDRTRLTTVTLAVMKREVETDIMTSVPEWGEGSLDRVEVQDSSLDEEGNRQAFTLMLSTPGSGKFTVYVMPEASYAIDEPETLKIDLKPFELKGYKIRNYVGATVVAKKPVPYDYDIYLSPASATLAQDRTEPSSTMLRVMKRERGGENKVSNYEGDVGLTFSGLSGHAFMEMTHDKEKNTVVVTVLPKTSATIPADRPIVYVDPKEVVPEPEGGKAVAQTRAAITVVRVAPDAKLGLAPLTKDTVDITADGDEGSVTLSEGLYSYDVDSGAQVGQFSEKVSAVQETPLDGITLTSDGYGYLDIIMDIAKYADLKGKSTLVTVTAISPPSSLVEPSFTFTLRII